MHTAEGAGKRRRLFRPTSSDYRRHDHGSRVRRGFWQASAEALNAGVDLLPFAYDWEKNYLAMDCLAQAQAAGKLVALEASQQRLARLPWRHDAESE